MRVLTILSAAFALAVSVNAAAINKRSVTAPVQACIDALNTANDQLAIVNGKLQSFTGAAGYTGATDVHFSELAYENEIQDAINACCAVTTTLIEEDATAVITVVGGIVPGIEQLLGDFIYKKPDFDAVLIMTGLIKSDIKNLQTKIETLDTCLVAVTPAADTTIIKSYVDRVNAAFATTAVTYNI